MSTRWLFFNSLNSNLPSWASSSSSPLKTPTFSLYHGDISHLLSLCGKHGHLRLGTSLHASIIKNPHFFNNPTHPQNLRISILISNSILSMYSKCGELFNAQKLFDRMPHKDTVSWNSMISGFLSKGEFHLGFGLFNRLRSICKFDRATLTTVLSACDEPQLCYATKMIHCLVLLDGFQQEITVGNALITSYFKCECFSMGRRVYDEMYEKNVVTWTAIISGLVQNQFYQEGLSLFMMMRRGLVSPNSVTYLSSLVACAGLDAINEGRQIHAISWKVGIQSELCIESALMDMYCKCGNMEDAWKIFESAIKVDEVSMTVMLVGFAQNGYEEEAIQLFLHLVNTGYMVDPNMVSAILGVFGVDTSLIFGQQLHSLIIKRSFGLNPFVSNGLINMYSKCGDLRESTKVFDRMVNKNSISWNSIIAAFARHGNALKALELYEEMLLDGIQPTDVTFLSLLHACSHVGLVEKGMEYLESMSKVHNISPRMEHYACVVDMLGRAGLLNEAKSFINQLPKNPNSLVWQALLGACGVHGDAEMGKYAALELSNTAPENPMSYILLANIYSSKGKWKERAKSIKRMKEMGVSKETGISWIEIDKRVHSFVVEDRMHPQAEIIYDVLEELFGLLIDEGYVPDKRFILFKLDTDED